MCCISSFHSFPPLMQRSVFITSVVRLLPPHTYSTSTVTQTHKDAFICQDKS